MSINVQQLLHQMAGYLMTGCHLAEQRQLLATAIFPQRAAGVKGTAAWWIDRAGQFTGTYRSLPRPLEDRVGQRHS